MKPLSETVAVVAGATRGAGRGIACMLGEAGATVYCAGRSTEGRPATPGRSETIEQTARMVTERGGIGIPVRTDHTVESEVVALIDRVKSDHNRLDLLVNDVWGGDALTEWGTPFWELSLDRGFTMIEQAVNSHIITARHAAPLMVAQQHGLIIEITDGDFYGYRGNFFYDLVKTTIIRIAFAMNRELHSKNVTALALTPGFLRSEAVLDYFGVSESNWQDGAKTDPHFLASETPFYVGRAVAALAADSSIAKKGGRVFTSWDLAVEYGFTDIDGRKPHWDRHVRETIPGWTMKKCGDAFYELWEGEMGIAPDS